MIFGRSVLSRLHRRDGFESMDELKAFARKLWDLRERGVVEEIPALSPLYEYRDEYWIRDRRSTRVFRFVPPEFPFSGAWHEVPDPTARSYFRALEPEYYLDPGGYQALLRRLSEALARGEIERATDMQTGVTRAGVHGITYYFHKESGECFSLTPPTSASNEALWHKVYPRESGTWYGDLVVG
jgi:hypothetical protein